MSVNSISGSSFPSPTAPLLPVPERLQPPATPQSLPPLIYQKSTPPTQFNNRRDWTSFTPAAFPQATTHHPATSAIFVVHPAAAPRTTEPSVFTPEIGLSAKRILTHTLAALGFFASIRVLHHFPGGSNKLKYATVLSPDPKEWIKVGLGIAGMSQLTSAFNWKPPVWLNAMMNVMIISPLVAGFSKNHVIQGALLAPVVGALAEGTHQLSEATQKPLEEKFHIPQIVTRIAYSAAMVLLGLRIFPWVNQSIPRLATAEGTIGAETSTMTTCVNGCCSSIVCINDIGQLGAALVKAGTAGTTTTGVLTAGGNHA